MNPVHSKKKKSHLYNKNNEGGEDSMNKTHQCKLVRSSISFKKNHTNLVVKRWTEINKLFLQLTDDIHGCRYAWCLSLSLSLPFVSLKRSDTILRKKQIL